MRVEKLKYVIWAGDRARAEAFYREVFGAENARSSEVMSEWSVGGGLIAIHGGGEGKRTWTGLAFQVDDLYEASALVKQHGGQVLREPVDTPEEPAHLVMCVDPEGNEFMVTKARTPSTAPRAEGR